MIMYLPSSTSEVWDSASPAFLKRRKYALLGGKKKRGGRKVGEANREADRGRRMDSVCVKNSTSLVKKIK